LCHIRHLLRRKTDELSGGEKQRIALARVLFSSPRLLLLDEPFSNLDVGHKTVLKKVIDSISEHLKVSCILVSHDPLDVLSWADEIVVMENGSIVQTGSPHEVYYQPVSEYTAGLFGPYNLIDASSFGLSSERRLFLRPEQLEITGGGNGSGAYTVKSHRFFGSFFLCTISNEGGDLLVFSNETDSSKEKKVDVSLKKHDYWFL
jgi:ABC-type sugar transport system ATPase subunit